MAVTFTAMPHYASDALQAYTGYFHCENEQLNRVWYAGAYTDQLCTIESDAGDALVHINQVNSSEPGDTVPPLTWYNNYTIASKCALILIT